LCTIGKKTGSAKSTFCKDDQCLASDVKVVSKGNCQMSPLTDQTRHCQNCWKIIQLTNTSFI